MLLTISGGSGAGKSELAKILEKNFGYNQVITCTTRNPRPNEIDGEDYYFISDKEFRDKITNNDFIEYTEYTDNRLYGTLKNDIYTALIDSKNIHIVVVTPNGMRAIKNYAKELGFEKKLQTVYLTASLGDRIKRYIDRLDKKFNFTDMAEINQRVNRDFGMFLDFEKEVDLVFDNSGDDIDYLNIIALDIDSILQHN